SWDALRKSITGIVSRVNVADIKQVVPEPFSENLIRGRGPFARSVMKAQASSLPFTPVFAALVAIINTKLPQVGELVLTRLISQFRRAFKRNDKTVCHSSTTFIAHLVNQAVAHEIIALETLIFLLERRTDDSIEIAVGFMREVGAFLAENSPKANALVFDRFRDVLNEGTISHRVQYMIEVLMQVRKDKYKDNPIIPDGLDLVKEEELQAQEGLNIFKFDPNYTENEEKYKAIKAEILGEGSDDESGPEESSKEEEQEREGILDRTGTNLVNLRRMIYLTIMNALNYEEAVHKLLKIQSKEGEEIELINMIIECCSQERSYSTFYGLVGERFSRLNRVWMECIEQAFDNYYHTVHQYKTSRRRSRRSPTPRRDYSKGHSQGPARSPDGSRDYRPHGRDGEYTRELGRNYVRDKYREDSRSPPSSPRRSPSLRRSHSPPRRSPLMEEMKDAACPGGDGEVFFHWSCQRFE
ncbi:armadillo-type protein, partial [Pisolithus tinctorius]